MLGRRSRTRGCTVLAFVGAAAFAHVAHAAGRDKVYLKGGRSQVGTVIGDNAEGVKLRLPGNAGTSDFSRDQVVRVEYAGTPNEYRIGFRYFTSGNHEGALRYMNDALECKHPGLLKQYILYYVAKSHQKLNETEQAIPAFEGIVNQGKKSRFLNEAFESLIELYSDAGRIDDAKALLRKLPRPKNVSQKLRRLIHRAVIEEKAGNPRKAVQTYAQVRRESGPGRQEEKAKAGLGVARCMLALKKYGETAREVRGLIKSGKLGEHYAAAYVILGEALMQTAKTDEDYEAAILAYLRVPALYPGQEATEAKALLRAGQAYEQITGNEQAKKRAGKLFAMLRDKYPNSSYAEEARK